MHSLFIDTHNDLMVVVLYQNGEVLGISKIGSNQNHSNNLIPTISKLLEKNNLKSQDINEIIVVNGPGSFTGIRIGVTVAKTFAYALKLPIKSITSLEQKNINNSSKSLKLVVENDKNGYFCGIFENKKLIKEMFYLSNIQFKKYIEENNYEGNIVDDIGIDYKKVYDFTKRLPVLNYHEVKPIYVKQIEALND